MHWGLIMHAVSAETHVFGSADLPKVETKSEGSGDKAIIRKLEKILEELIDHPTKGTGKVFLK